MAVWPERIAKCSLSSGLQITSALCLTSTLFPFTAFKMVLIHRDYFTTLAGYEINAQGLIHQSIYYVHPVMSFLSNSQRTRYGLKR